MHCLFVSPSKSPPYTQLVLTKHIKIPLSFMKMRSCTENKMSAPIQLSGQTRTIWLSPSSWAGQPVCEWPHSRPRPAFWQDKREREGRCGQAEDLRKEGDTVRGKWRTQPGETRGRKKYCSESFLADAQVCCSYWCGQVTGTWETALQTSKFH